LSIPEQRVTPETEAVVGMAQAEQVLPLCARQQQLLQWARSGNFRAEKWLPLHKLNA
jgi:hypothetical protein